MKANRTGQPRKPHPAGRAAAPVLRVAPFVALPDVLRERGVDYRDVIREFGLRPEYFADPENTLPFATAGRLVQRCVELTQCPHLGLVLAQNLGLSVLGAVGLLAQSAPNVRQALTAISRYLHLHDAGAAVTLAVDGEHATMGYAVLAAHVQGVDQIEDFAVVVIHNILKTLCGPTWRPIEVCFAHGMPPDLAPYRATFQSPLRFDAKTSAVVFPARWVDQPVISADPLMHRFMEARVREIAASSPSDFVAHARRAIHATLSMPGGALGTVARQLGTSGRTLNRRLAESGTSIARLREALRKAEAVRLLTSTRISVGELSAMLGYSSDSAFSRAFKDWYGVAPTKWRAGQRAGARRRGLSRTACTPIRHSE
jgi:AraC-like DNA-binding protein